MPSFKDAIFLIVDDAEAMRRITATQLRSLGAEQILTARSGNDALQILARQRVDVILADWYMPVMSGLELLHAVRADARLRHLPLIMITAEAERERVAEAIAAGVSDLLVKPYTAERLGSRIARAMSARVRAPVAGAAGAETRAVTSAATPGEVRPPTLLIVDDTPDNLHLLSHLFKEEYQVRVASNGEKALAICTSDDPPDLVLLDVMMPGIDGFEVAQRMRDHPGAESIPIIFVTAISGDEARTRGMELGAVDFITKPIDPNVLKPRVRNFIRYVALRKRLQADYDEMLEAARLRDDVEQITRHDLRGPLAGVIGLIRNIIADPDMDQSERRHQLRLAEESALQALDMINLSSELFRIETGRFQLDAKPVRIGDVLRRIAEISNAAVADKRLRLNLSRDGTDDFEKPLILGDAMLCHSLFQNLVKNACEAAPPGSEVSITVHDLDPVWIVITNRGALPPEIRERFFDKFATAGKHGGTGLGTYSARLLTEAQGGRISVATSDETDTTSVTVELPRAPAD
ncbi:MAG: response regulator [Azospira sp.]|jgi:CheY-like chemotaxis protein|nr:response regulator [Azospira sp.]